MTNSSTSQIQLADLDIRHIDVFQLGKPSAGCAVILPTVGSKKSGQLHAVATPLVVDRPPLVSDGDDSHELLTFPDRYTAREIVKAIVHAAELCGAGRVPVRRRRA